MGRNSYALLETGWIPGHLDAFKPNAVGKIRLYDGGGGGSAPAPSSVSQTTIPEYAQPYAERMLGKAEAITETPYQTYGGERIAESTAQQQAARQSVAGMQGPTQFGTGTQLATQAGIAGLGAGQYQPGVFAAPLTQAAQLRQFQMRGPADVTGMQLNAPQMGTAHIGARPDLETFQMGPAERVGATGVSARDIQAAQTGFAPQLERFQMTAPERFGAGAAQEYMSPYMQGVVDVQKREAVRDAQKTQLGANLAAARQGTYGGARQLLAQTERERALGTQLGDIQAKGLEAAFGQAQSQFERDRAAQMGAQKENLQAALGVQQLGTQTGMQTALANLTNEQQARVTSEANRLQAQGMTQDAALKAALANQQAGLTTGQQNLAAQLGVQQLGTQTGLQVALANLSSEQQANVQNLTAQLQTQGLSADQALRAALANQQAGLTTAQQNLQARLGVQQLGAQTDLESQRLNQQALMEAQRLAEQSRQFGGTLGLQGAQAATQAAQVLGGLGGAQQAAGLDLAKAQEAFGGLGRAEQQAKLDLAYQDFLQQQRYPYSQLGFMSDILRGSGNLAATGGRAVYEQPPSTTQQLMQLGLGGLGLYRSMGMPG